MKGEVNTVAYMHHLLLDFLKVYVLYVYLHAHNISRHIHVYKYLGQNEISQLAVTALSYIHEIEFLIYTSAPYQICYSNINIRLSKAKLLALHCPFDLSLSATLE